jgi:hypothetical protein
VQRVADDRDQDCFGGPGGLGQAAEYQAILAQREVLLRDGATRRVQ